LEDIVVTKEKGLSPEEKFFEALLGEVPETQDPSPLDEVAKKESGEKLQKKINEVVKALTNRDREIIRLRYGLGSGYTHTLEEVGRIFKVTRERVRQIEAMVARKLQHPSRSKKKRDEPPKK